MANLAGTWAFAGPLFRCNASLRTIPVLGRGVMVSVTLGVRREAAVAPGRCLCGRSCSESPARLSSTQVSYRCVCAWDWESDVGIRCRMTAEALARPRMVNRGFSAEPGC